MEINYSNPGPPDAIVYPDWADMATPKQPSQVLETPIITGTVSAASISITGSTQ